MAGGAAPAGRACPTPLHFARFQPSPAARHVWVPSRRTQRLQLLKVTSADAPQAAGCQQQQQQQQLEFPAQAESIGCNLDKELVANSSAASTGTQQGGAATAALAATHDQQQQRQQQQQQQSLQQRAPKWPVDSISSSGRSTSSSSSTSACNVEQPPEIGVAPHIDLEQLASGAQQQRPRRGASPAAPAAPGPPDPAAAAVAAGAAAAGSSATADAGLLYPPSERTQIRNSWNSLMRWARYFRWAMPSCMTFRWQGPAALALPALHTKCRMLCPFSSCFGSPVRQLQATGMALTTLAWLGMLQVTGGDRHAAGGQGGGVWRRQLWHGHGCVAGAAAEEHSGEHDGHAGTTFWKGSRLSVCCAFSLHVHVWWQIDAKNAESAQVHAVSCLL